MKKILEQAIKRLNTTVEAFDGIKHLENIRAELCHSRDKLENELATLLQIEKEIQDKNQLKLF